MILFQSLYEKIINEVHYENSKVLLSGANPQKHNILKDLGIIEMDEEDKVFFKKGDGFIFYLKSY